MPFYEFIFNNVFAAGHLYFEDVDFLQVFEIDENVVISLVHSVMSPVASFCVLYVDVIQQMHFKNVRIQL